MRLPDESLLTKSCRAMWLNPVQIATLRIQVISLGNSIIEDDNPQRKPQVKSSWKSSIAAVLLKRIVIPLYPSYLDSTLFPYLSVYLSP